MRKSVVTLYRRYGHNRQESDEFECHDVTVLCIEHVSNPPLVLNQSLLEKFAYQPDRPGRTQQRVVGVSGRKVERLKNKKKSGHITEKEKTVAAGRDIHIYVIPSMLSKVHRRRFRTRKEEKGELHHSGVASARLSNILHAALSLVCYSLIQQVRVRGGGIKKRKRRG